MNTISVKFRLKLTLDEIKIFSKAGLGSEQERDGEGERKRKQEKGRGRWVSSLASREERERKRKNEREKGMSELQGWHIPRPDINEAGGKEEKEDGGNSCLNQLIFMFSIHILLPIKE